MTLAEGALPSIWSTAMVSETSGKRARSPAATRAIRAALPSTSATSARRGSWRTYGASRRKVWATTGVSRGAGSASERRAMARQESLEGGPAKGVG